ncbi:hypothetical protein PILCRDRAFT_631443 [Piloderma croceum F 1598]|uniref:Uncharacterized protein n=1 Tax=Piloderma croceum (strain F 1598) TaxID=765440 RepID=A0A0C3FBH1_PILCF|nr:hypothetical protein PILCRDRAFT_631443 [Piloderma croceum F 1598]
MPTQGISSETDGPKIFTGRNGNHPSTSFIVSNLGNGELKEYKASVDLTEISNTDTSYRLLTMHFNFTQLAATAIILLTARSVLADSGNCKCQDANGQYNDLTCQCCNFENTNSHSTKCPGENHQCTSTWSPDDIYDKLFDECCKSLGVGGAFCW